MFSIDNLSSDSAYMMSRSYSFGQRTQKSNQNLSSTSNLTQDKSSSRGSPLRSPNPTSIFTKSYFSPTPTPNKKFFSSSLSQLQQENKNSFNESISPSSPSPSSPEKNIQKLLKFQARKQRQQILETEQPILEENQKISEMFREIKLEKDKWSSKLNKENHLLIKLLKDVTDSKKLLSSKLKEVEEIKKSYSSLRAQASGEGNLLSQYLLKTCPLSESRRLSENIPVERLEDSQKVYDKMLSLSLKLDEVYLHQKKKILQAYEEISDNFLKENDENIKYSFSYINNFLENLNRYTHAAEFSSFSNLELKEKFTTAEEDIINAASKSIINTFRASSNYNTLNYVHDTQNSTSDPLESSETVIGNSYKKIRELTIQNEVLTKENENLKKNLKKSEALLDNALNHSLSNKENLSLPPQISQLLLKSFSDFVSPFLNGHPLSEGVTSEVLKEVEEQIIEDLIDEAKAHLLSFLSSSVNEQLLNILDPNHHEDYEETVKDLEVQKEIEEGIKVIVRLSPLHADLSSLSTLYLTYVQSNIIDYQSIKQKFDSECEAKIIEKQEIEENNRRLKEEREREEREKQEHELKLKLEQDLYEIQNKSSSHEDEEDVHVGSFSSYPQFASNNLHYPSHSHHPDDVSISSNPSVKSLAQLLSTSNNNSSTYIPNNNSSSTNNINNISLMELDDTTLQPPQLLELDEWDTILVPKSGLSGYDSNFSIPVPNQDGYEKQNLPNATLNSQQSTPNLQKSSSFNYNPSTTTPSKGGRYNQSMNTSSPTPQTPYEPYEVSSSSMLSEGQHTLKKTLSVSSEKVPRYMMPKKSYSSNNASSNSQTSPAPLNLHASAVPTTSSSYMQFK